MARNEVGARELKTRLGTYLQRVRAGKTLVVTDRGLPIAELRPVGAPTDRMAVLARLHAVGAVTLPTTHRLAPFTPIELHGESLSAAVLEDRADRF